MASIGRNGKGRKAASFSGRSLTMENIIEELESLEVKSNGEKGDGRKDLLENGSGIPRARPHKSTGDDSAYITGYSTTETGSVASDPDEDDDRVKCVGELMPSKHMSLDQIPYPAVSISISNRRMLGRRRTREEEPEMSEMKRVPSSLFYFQYGEEDGDLVHGKVGKQHIPRKDIPTSRKFSAASNYSFFEDEDDEEEQKEEEEEEEERDKEAESGIDENREVERILNDSQSCVETSSDFYRQTLRQIDQTTKPFRLSDDVYQQVKTLLGKEMSKGLQREGNHQSTVKMYPTYVRSLPSGTEAGRFLALDLGGTNFRVLLVDLKGRDPPKVTSKLYLIPTSLMFGTGTALFDHIADRISEFLDEFQLKEELRYAANSLPLGFTFSFPCAQDGLASARLVRWTKGFQCSGVENQDVVRLLREAIERKGDLNVECVAIINDNVGVLMAAAHTDANCKVGVILGTGTNCCYVENLDHVELWDEDRSNPKQVIINTEWGAFGDNGILDFVRNTFDRTLDEQSLNPGHQLFEKMISGMYMGEIVRLILCELTLKGLLFGGIGSEELFQKNRFYTKYISEIESDDPLDSMTNTRMILEELNIERYTRDDCRYVQHVCWQVSQRSAFLAGTAVVAVIERLDVDQVTVAVDGSVYRFHPHFKHLMHKKITHLMEPDRKFKLVLANDGSGKGAAIVAAVTHSQQHQQHSPSAEEPSSSSSSTSHSSLSPSSSSSSSASSSSSSPLEEPSLATFFIR